jgi:O-antigen/teichoic acid export membrane protein
MTFYISQQPLNPVARVLAALLGAFALVGAFFFGLIILAVVVGLALLLWLGFRLRLWWVMRNMPRAESAPPGAAGPDDVIDAEYTVVSKRQEP